MKIQYLILMAIIPFTSKAWTPCGTDSKGNTANCEYQIENNVLTIRGLGDNGNIGVWEAIHHPAPWYGQSVNNVVIENSIKNLGYQGFAGIISNNPIEIPSNVQNISNDAFKYLRATEVIIPGSVQSIGAYSFCYSSVKKINIPDSVTSIGLWAFLGAENLVDVVIPNSVTTIGTGAFSGCTSLKTLTIGEDTILGDIFKNYASGYLDTSNLKIYCTGDTEKCDQNLRNAGYDNLTTIKATEKTINGIKYILDSKGNIVATSGNRKEKRIYTLEEAQARVKEIGKDHVTFRIRYK